MIEKLLNLYDLIILIKIKIIDEIKLKYFIILI